MDVPKSKFAEVYGVTPPDELEQIARGLPDVPDLELSDYASVILILHDQKDQSFSKIVGFLKQHGIEANRSAVYRVYKDAKLPKELKEPLVDDDTGEIIEP